LLFEGARKQAAEKAMEHFKIFKEEVKED